ncbi:MAG TPA: Ig-like domain-containing protein [Bryobacteraceae bacterium]|nr:Ig-like domain-containing protein [Bryobacteraceae bacterium]
MYYRFISRTLIALCLVSGSVAFSQTVSIVSGQGQLVRTSNIAQFPLVVLVRDASGNPVPNASVAWKITGGGTILHASTTTDSTGQSTNSFIGANVLFPTSFAQSTIAVTYKTASATFYMTTAGQDNSGTILVQAIPSSPTFGQLPLIGQSGAVGPVPVKIRFQAISGFQAGQGISNVAVRAFPAISNSATTIACQGGLVLSDSNGNANCPLVFGGKVGQGNFTVDAGGLTEFTYSFQVIAGPPGLISVSSGNNQSGSPGQLLASPLVATVSDLGGNPSPGVNLVFESVPAGAVTLSDVRATSDSTGRVSARATIGNVSGAVQVRVRTSDGKISALFNITVNVVVASLQKVSGDQQDPAVINTAFANPLVVQVNDANSNPVLGAPVTFTVTSGSATVTTPSTNTNAQGQASTIVTAGSATGPVVITASSGTFSVTFNLTVRSPGPSCKTGSTFYNGAGFKVNWISPGGVATIVCTGLAPGIQGSVAGTFVGGLLYQVANVSVTFGTTPAPIYNVSNVNGTESVSVQVPMEAQPGPETVTVTVNGGSTTVNANILQGAPGIFEYGEVGSDGRRQAVIARPDGSFVSANNPIHRGEIGRAYVTGLIPPPNSIGTNMTVPLDGDISITTPVIVGINNAGVLVPSVKYAHNLIGVWEVEFIVPTNTAPGARAPFALAIPANGGLAFAQGSTINVQ